MCTQELLQMQRLPPLSLTPIVAKPPTIASRSDQSSPSTSQLAVLAFLKRKHDTYLRRLSLTNSEISTQTIPTGCSNTWDLPGKDIAAHVVHCAKINLVAKRKRSLILVRKRHKSRSYISADDFTETFPKMCRVEKSRSECLVTNDSNLNPKKCSTHVCSPTKLGVALKSLIQDQRDPTMCKLETKKCFAKSKGLTAPNVSNHLSEDYCKWILPSNERQMPQTKDRIESSPQQRACTKLTPESNECDTKLKAEQQRAEIYALNEAMSRYEEENLQTFISVKV